MVTLWAEGHLLVRDPNKNTECFILKCPVHFITPSIAWKRMVWKEEALDDLP